MSVPKMVVLGLLVNGDRHGYEMEEEIERSRMRLWAKIGTSSIYKALLDLEGEGCVVSRPGIAARGPGKRVFSITEKGRAAFSRLVEEALTSAAPVYSIRITGLAFAMSLQAGDRKNLFSRSREGLKEGSRQLKDERKRARGSTARILIDYYQDILAAEIRALERAIHLAPANHETRTGNPRESPARTSNIRAK